MQPHLVNSLFIHYKEPERLKWTSLLKALTTHNNSEWSSGCIRRRISCRAYNHGGTNRKIKWRCRSACHGNRTRVVCRSRVGPYNVSSRLTRIGIPRYVRKWINVRIRKVSTHYDFNKCGDEIFMYFINITTTRFDTYTLIYTPFIDLSRLIG